MIRIYKGYFLPISLILGSVIGAGYLALPNVVQKVGLFWGLFYLVGSAFLMIVTYLLYTDTLLNTPGKHNFVSLADLYLGGLAKNLAILITILATPLVLLIYLILSINFLNLIYPLPAVGSVLLFWALSSLIICSKLKRLAFSEFVASLVRLLIMLLIFLWGAPQIPKIVSSIGYINFPWEFFWLPVGPFLFAFAGRASVSELVNYTRKNVQKLIIISFGTVAVLYALFILGVSAISPVVSEDTISGLAGILPYWFLVLIGVFGWVALWSAYTLIGFDTRNILEVDLHWRPLLSTAVVLFTPLLLYFAGLREFLVLISLVGGLFLVAESIFMILMWWKMKKHFNQKLFKHKQWLIYLVLVIFVIIFIHELVVQTTGLPY